MKAHELPPRVIEGAIDKVLFERTRIALRVLCFGTAVFFVGDLARYRGAIPFVHVIQVAVIAITLGAQALLARLQTSRAVKILAVGVCAMACLASGLGGATLGTLEATPLLLIAVTLAAATYLPWGLLPQLVVVGSAVVALAVNVHLVGGWGLQSYPETLAIGVLLSASIVIAAVSDRQRRGHLKIDRQRRRSESRFQLLVETTNVVPWEADLQRAHFTYVGPQAAALLGYPLSAWYEEGFWQAHIHPEDRDWALFWLREKSRGERSSSFEYRMLTADGRVIWVLDSITVEKSRGQSERLLGFLLDVSEGHRHEQHKGALLAVARDLGEVVEVAPMLERTACHTAEAVGCDAVAVFTWDPREGAFRIVGHYGIPEAELPMALELRFGQSEPFGGRVSRGESVLVNEIDAYPNLPLAALAVAGIRRLLVSPLLAGGRNDGRLVAIRRSGPPFTHEDSVLMEGIARQLGGALYRAQLYEAQQENARVSAALVELSHRALAASGTNAVYELLCEQVVGALGCDAVYLWLRDAKKESYSPVSYCGGSLQDWEATQALSANRLDEHIQRLLRERVVVADGADLLGMPSGDLAVALGIGQIVHVVIEHNGTALGCLSCHYVGRSIRWDRFHQRVAEGISDIAALVVENNRLIEELGQANRVKSEFVATMSHELRTPLNAIMGYTELLSDGVFGTLNEEQVTTLKRVRVHSGSLLDLINQTLDVGRLESKSLAIYLSVRKVDEILAEINAETHELQQRPGLEVAWDVASDVPPLHTDVAKLRVALRNLLHNAMKFTPAGRVTVAVRRVGDEVELSVSDTGVGIPEEARSLIFEAFRQVDGSLTRRFGGVGLGLYITQPLGRPLAGRVTVESELGGGSTFRIRIPIEHPDAVAALIRRAALPAMPAVVHEPAAL